MRKLLKISLGLGLLALVAWGLLWLFPLTSPEGEAKVALLSWNLHGLHSEGGENTAKLIYDGLRATDADILLFQEFPVGRAGVAVRERLRSLGYPQEALFAYNHSRTDRYSMGLAVYSRHPIRSRAEFALMPHGEGRVLGLVQIEVEGRLLRVGVVHMPNSDIHLNGKRAMISSELVGENLRTLQSEDLLEHLELWRDEAMVVAGDFNTFPMSSAWRVVRGRYLDAFPVSEWGSGTFDIGDGLEVKIDHIFHTRKVRSLGARVPALAGSDHQPVYALLQF